MRNLAVGAGIGHTQADHCAQLRLVVLGLQPFFQQGLGGFVLVRDALAVKTDRDVGPGLRETVLQVQVLRAVAAAVLRVELENQP